MKDGFSFLVKRNLTSLILSVSTCLLLPLNPITAETGPVADPIEAEYDFGRVMQGHRVVHEFSLKNAGDADLVLQRLAPSCGCTAAAVTSNTIKPGTSEKVRVTFDTSGMYGGKTKTVLIQTNSRERPEVTLKLIGSVVRGINANPERIAFGEVSKGSSNAARTKEVEISVVEGMDWEVTHVTSLSKFLTISQIADQGNTKRYSVTLSADAPKGELRDRLVVEFKDPSHAAVNIPITASILGDLRVSPASVSFGIISGSAPLERRLRYQNSSGNPVAIKGITSSHPAVTAKMVEVESGKQGVIVVALNPSKVSGDLRATIRIETDHPEQSELSVSVYGVQPPK